MNRPAIPFTGIHHISAMTADAQANVDFYTQALGLRLIKKTVNQDDVSVYHLFYTDAEGAPGTDLTFFDFPNLAKNRPGSGEITEIAFRVPTEASLRFWDERLDAIGVDHDAPRERYGRQVLEFRDPEGQRLALIADGDDAKVPAGTPWPHAGIPEEHAIVGLSAISTSTARPHATLPVLTDVMGFRVIDEIPDPDNAEHRTVVLESGEGGPGALYYLHVQPGLPQARLGRGGVHHVAFRTPDAETHKAWREYLGARGMNITPEIDRFYFLAAYFREPGGVLFEISSDTPGFKTDQTEDELGVELALPPFLQPYREQIAAGLHPIDTSRERTSQDAAALAASA